LIPAFLGGALIWNSEKVESTAVVGGVIVLLLAWIITSVILGVLYEVLSSVFIMYCIDNQMRMNGLTAGNIPP